jgi:hypothetical protein
MTSIRVAVQLLLAYTVVLASLHVPIAASDGAQRLVLRGGPLELSDLRQIPNVLQQIVEAVRKAVRKVEEDLRRQLCSSCPVSMVAVVAVLLLAIGHDLTRRK